MRLPLYLRRRSREERARASQVYTITAPNSSSAKLEKGLEFHAKRLHPEQARRLSVQCPQCLAVPRPFAVSGLFAVRSQ
eukprot:15469691-Alexandrium_andersonii.AAC.1